MYNEICKIMYFDVKVSVICVCVLVFCVYFESIWVEIECFILIEEVCEVFVKGEGLVL